MLKVPEKDISSETKEETSEKQTSSDSLKITYKDICEVDQRNKIVTSDIYEANKNLYHKEYDKYKSEVDE